MSQSLPWQRCEHCNLAGSPSTALTDDASGGSSVWISLRTRWGSKAGLVGERREEREERERR